MALRIGREQPIDAEARRIADKQLRLAIAGLGTPDLGDHDHRLHTARRHLKKLRALIRLFGPHLGPGAGHEQRRLRTTIRRLAAIADSEALVTTFGMLTHRYPGALPPATEAQLRAALRAREAEARRLADFAGTRRKVAAALVSALPRVRAWAVDARGVDAVAPGLKRSVRRGRRAMRRALARPTTRRYSRWRRRTKDLWFQMRLIESCTGGGLRQDQQRLEQLDGVLGEARNCALLADALSAGALASRRETAICLRLVRRYRSDLRREAAALAPLVHGDRPGDVVARVERLWCAAASRAPGAGRVSDQRRAAAVAGSPTAVVPDPEDMRTPPQTEGSAERGRYLPAAPT